MNVGLFPSFRYNNNRNFWLEYSTPPSTTFPDYDEEYYELKTTTPDPGPAFVDASRRNGSTVEVPLGATVFLDCIIQGLTQDFEVSNPVIQLGLIQDALEVLRHYKTVFNKCCSAFEAHCGTYPMHGM